MRLKYKGIVKQVFGEFILFEWQDDIFKYWVSFGYSKEKKPEVRVIQHNPFGGRMIKGPFANSIKYKITTHSKPVSPDVALKYLHKYLKEKEII